VTLKALETNTPLTCNDSLTRLAHTTTLTFPTSSSNASGTPRIHMDSRDITLQIRTPIVTKSVSMVASHAGVREALTKIQRRLASAIDDAFDDFGGVVMEGRDVGSTVLPQAQLKIYLDGDARIRALRRLQEMVKSGLIDRVDEDSILKMEEDIRERDRKDIERKVSPLKKAPDAVVVDTSVLTLDEQVAMIEAVARVRIAEWRE
ncbi:hypothetical protein HDU67_001637, partial [Dinochytrium kinnereticum]